MNRLRNLGLTQALVSQVPHHQLDQLGRVTFLSRNHALVATEADTVSARLHPRSERCVVGDWVLLDRSGDPVWIVQRLERLRALARRDPDRGVQVLCAHIDRLLVVTALDRDLNERRLERYLAVSAEAQIPCGLVLTKIDLHPEATLAVTARLGRLFDPILPVCAPTGEGLDGVRDAVPSGVTAALLGSSGVGKSTLAAALTGETFATGSVRKTDSRGRHTTTTRRLVPIPDRGWLVDNPGLRQVGPVGSNGVAQVFDEVEALAAQCRFRDCAHDGEPGCAIAAAIEAGALEVERYDAWVKLQREMAYEVRRLDRDAARLERARWKRIHLDARRRERFRNDGFGGSGGGKPPR